MTTKTITCRFEIPFTTVAGATTRQYLFVCEAEGDPDEGPGGCFRAVQSVVPSWPVVLDVDKVLEAFVGEHQLDELAWLALMRARHLEKKSGVRTLGFRS